jgi:hypothetical protein
LISIYWWPILAGKKGKEMKSFLFFLGLLGALFMFRPLGASAAELSVGIPTPPFGLSETVASVYGSANYYTHWVDNSGTCSDSGNGSPNSPRCTIPNTSSLAAGTVIQLRGGPYSLSANWVISGTGTASQPIFIRGSDSVRVQINTNSRQTGLTCTYCIMESLKFTGRDEAVGIASTYVGFRNNEIVGTGTSVDGNGAMISSGSSSFVVIADNIVHDGGAWQSSTENDMHALGVGSNEHDIWYLGNTVYHNAGDGIGNGHDANHTTSRLFIGGNIFYENRENAIDLKEVNDVIISENQAYNYVASSSSPGEAIVLHYGPTTDQGPYNVWVIDNVIHDAVYGIVTSDVQAGIYIIGNLVYNCTAGINPDRSGGYVYVYHNTVVDCGTGIYSGGSGGALNEYEVHGNIVSNVTAGNHMGVYSSTVRSLAHVGNELYYQGGGNVSIGWGTTYTSVAAWIAGTTVGDNSLQVDPLFVSAGSRNYSLQSGSPAIQAGYNMSTVASAFSTAWGTSLLKDLAGTTRPNGVWDIGAYEYGGSTPPSTPKTGDLNSDNAVDILDYNLLVSHFGQTGSGIVGDIDANNKVDIFDYNILVSNFGK